MRFWATTFLAGLALAGPLHADTVQIDRDGVNGADAPVLFLQESLEWNFPDYTIASAQHPNPYGAEPDVFAFSRDGEVVLFADVGQDEIFTFSLWTEAASATGPDGVRIGTTTVADIIDLPHWECMRGYYEMKDVVSCMWWDESLRLVFSFDPQGKDNIDSGTFDPVLLSSELIEIRQYLSRPIQ